MFTQIEYGILIIIGAINIVSFAVMMNDKRRSIRGGATERIPEGILFFLAAAAGAIGIYAAMHLLRHKTRKWYFQIGIPLLIVQNAATLYLLWDILAVKNI